jgi:hypothetical protein
MAGQQQIENYNRDKLIKTHAKKLNFQADLNFAEKRFKIQSNYNREEFLHSYLLGGILESKECELQKFIDKKLRGALGDENIVVVDLKVAQTKYRDINNYYSQPFEWEDEIKW